MTMKVHQVAKLEAAYRDGLMKDAAASACDISWGTADSYFGKFAKAGVLRGAIKRRKEGPRRRYGSPTPYAGPDWIGKPA